MFTRLLLLAGKVINNDYHCRCCLRGKCNQKRPSEFWAAATPRDSAAAQVQGSLPPGWEARLTGWRLGVERIAELQMAPNTVRRIA